ncbi:long-chain-fatty-acid--CoA ligase [Bacillus carboniphilus]|uniref:Long-chain-fatty-acid--CoA ligase n=1 Tax=Bacillus carboniphilus TaxID=86663 RepID=A0ABY9JXM9_9BACI|nr:long-chain-fatty-acid--CoA ligase [Bacillus carboniphilus]WLR44134.1 long-chain-fatty-acid--CoA ligase [Bacillus carboniphilus]
MDTIKPWLQKYPDWLATEVEWDDIPLQEYLKKTAQEYPQKTAIYFLGKKLTYEEVYESSLKMANYLKYLGLEKGDRVSIMLPNCPQSVIAYYATLLAGGIVVQTNPLYMEKEIEYQINDSGADIVITLDLLYPRVSKVKALTKLKHVIVTSLKDYLPFPKNVLYPIVQGRKQNVVVDVEHKGDSHLWTEIMKQSETSEIDYQFNPKEDVAILQYTGGTTGSPKGVMLTHENLVSNTMMNVQWLNCEKGEESILGVVPFFHVYGMTTVMNISVMNAYKMVLLPKFDVKEVLKTIQKIKPTIFPGAPTIYIGLLNHPDIKKYDLSSIKGCVSGSAPLPVEVQEKFEEITGGTVIEGYGLSETSPTTHANFFVKEKTMRKLGSIGVPYPSTDAKIQSFDGEERAKPNERGELLIKGPQVMKGYWNNPEETEAVLQDGWFSTGDIGYMDEDGYFYIVDRKKDMIIAGGYNIYPREIEEVLYEHRDIQEAVVAGVPDPYRGETVKAYIVLKEGKTISEEELDQFCRKSLAAYKVPKIYEFRDELPKTAVGKILRRTLVEEEKKKIEKVN